MKGLIVKDFRLMLQRKRFFLIIGACSIIMAFQMQSGSFITGWATMFMVIFALSTLSYDEYDNCMPFLMSMPISARDYAVEKYVFGIICGLGGWLFAAVVHIGSYLIQKVPFDAVTELTEMSVFIAVELCILALCLPINFKWGPEKGRLYLLLIYGIAFLALFALNKMLPQQTDFAFVLDGFDAKRFILPMTALILLMLAASIFISIRIVKKKEY